VFGYKTDQQPFLRNIVTKKIGEPAQRHLSGFAANNTNPQELTAIKQILLIAFLPELFLLLPLQT